MPHATPAEPAPAVVARPRRFAARLSVHERATETLVGVLMALTSRGAAHAAADLPGPRTLVVASLGVTVAWGLVDAVLRLMESKGRRLRFASFAAAARDGQQVAPAYEGLASLLDEAGRARLTPAFAAAAATQQTSPRLDRDDWLDAVAVLLVVVASGIPPILPFLLVDDIEVAFQASNAVAGLLLLAVGVAWGRAHAVAPWRSGLGMLGLGAALVAALELLGG